MAEPFQQAQGNVWFFEVLPCRPLPYPGECLSGYLLRLAQANDFATFWDLVSDLFPMWRGPHQISLLRWEYPVDDWGRIPLRTQLPLTDLRKLTVAPLLEKFRPPPVLTRPSFLSPGHFLRGVVNPDLQVCPLCLQAQPYLRLMWQLAPVHVCLHHGCLLQAQCHRCGRPITVVSPSHRHLYCAACDTDLRTLPVVMASGDILATQQRRQADLQFLLDPEVTLVKPPSPESEEPAHDLYQAIGLKFRYLRLQTGQSVAEMARRIGTSGGMISSLELGRRAPLPLYLAYLEILSISWSDFAALEVPREFVRNLQEPPYLHLRLCPTPECPNHHPPPSTRVNVVADLPDRRMVRFRCRVCGRRFTRTYGGELVTKPRRPPIQPGESPPIVKSAEEIARLTEMGLQGQDNRPIARRLGWGEKTVRMYWIALGLEEQVHQAQAQRRAREKQQRHAALRARVEAVLQTMLDQDEEITLRRVGRALGCNSDYLHTHPDLAKRVHEVARQHNAQVRQRWYEALVVQITHAIEELKHGNGAMTISEIAQRVGLSYNKLHQSYPELHAMVRQALNEHQAEIKASRTKTECARINEAAVRLVVQETRLTYGAILKEAGLGKYRAKCDPVIRDLLQQWIGGFAPRD